MAERKLIRDIGNIDDDVIKAKRLIEDKLLNDEDIITALHNTDIGYDPDVREQYLDENIFSFINIPSAQDKVRNFICFAVDDIEDVKYNEAMKIQYVQFMVMVHVDDINTSWGMKRHDLLGAIIKDLFNWSNMFGTQLKLIYNKESVTDTNYQCRTLRFEATKVNSPYKNSRTNKYEYNNIHSGRQV
jgi:hypothetical protein